MPFLLSFSSSISQSPLSSIRNKQTFDNVTIDSPLDMRLIGCAPKNSSCNLLKEMKEAEWKADPTLANATMEVTKCKYRMTS